MSYSKSNNRATQSQKKFCKVCFDLKQPEGIYTSHYVRETPHPSSRVVCPNVKCKNCGQQGHFNKQCPEIIRERKREREVKITLMREMKKDKDATIINKKTTKNKFSALIDSDSESESDYEKPKTIVKKRKNINWAMLDSDSESDSE